MNNIVDKLINLSENDVESFRKLMIKSSSLLLPQIKDNHFKIKLEQLIKDDSIQNQKELVDYFWNQTNNYSEKDFKTNFKII